MLFTLTRIWMLITLFISAVPMIYWMWAGASTGFGLAVAAILLSHLLAYRALSLGVSWGWWVWLLGTTCCLLLLGPNVIYNIGEYINNNPLYLDSPSTILVVTVIALFLFVPQLICLALLLICRQQRCLPQAATPYATTLPPRLCSTTQSRA